MSSNRKDIKLGRLVDFLNLEEKKYYEFQRRKFVIPKLLKGIIEIAPDVYYKCDSHMYN